MSVKMPLRNSPRELELPGEGWIPVFLPERYLTRVIDLTNYDPSGNPYGFTFEVAEVEPDDGVNLSAYRAMKGYDDPVAQMQGVKDAGRTLAGRDRGILERVFSAHNASGRLALDDGSFVEVSPRVSAIQVDPEGR